MCSSVPQTTDKSAVETAIDNAKERCESGTTGECAAAWDEVRLALAISGSSIL